MSRKKKKWLYLRIVGYVIAFYLVVVMLLAGLKSTGNAADIFRNREISCTYHIQSARTVVTGDFNTVLCIFYYGERSVFVIDRITHNAVRLLQHNPDLLWMFNPGMERLIDLNRDGDADTKFTLLDISNKGATFEIQVFGYPESLNSLPIEPLQPVAEQPLPLPETATVIIPPHTNAEETWNVLEIVGIFAVFVLALVAIVRKMRRMA